LKTLDAVKKEVTSLKKKIADANTEISIMENKIAIKRNNWTEAIMADNDQAVILKEELNRMIGTYNEVKKNEALRDKIYSLYDKAVELKAEMELNYINAKEEIDIFNKFEVLSTSSKRANKIILNRPILEPFEAYVYDKFTKNKVIEQDNIRYERQMKLIRRQREADLKRLELKKKRKEAAKAEIKARDKARDKARAEMEGRTYEEDMQDMQS